MWEFARKHTVHEGIPLRGMSSDFREGKDEERHLLIFRKAGK